MNIDSIQIDRNTNQKASTQAVRLLASVATMIRRVRSWTGRGELEKARAHYRSKQQRQQQHRQDILDSLPLESKIGLGMHRWID